MSIDWSKPVFYVDGDEFTALMKDGEPLTEDDGSLIGAFKGRSGAWFSCTADLRDLSNGPEPVERWILIDADGDATQFTSKAEALDLCCDEDIMLYLHNTGGKWQVEEVK